MEVLKRQVGEYQASSQQKAGAPLNLMTKDAIHVEKARAYVQPMLLTFKKAC